MGLYFLYLSVVKGALSVFDCTMNKDGVYILDADPSILCNKVRYIYVCESLHSVHCHRGPHCQARPGVGRRMTRICVYHKYSRDDPASPSVLVPQYYMICRVHLDRTPSSTSVFPSLYHRAVCAVSLVCHDMLWSWLSFCAAVVLLLCYRGAFPPALQPGGVQESLKPAAGLSIAVYTIGLPLTFLFILLNHRHAIFADQTLRMANAGSSEATNPNFHIRRRYQELYRCVCVLGGGSGGGARGGGLRAWLA
jgi:hypothetical protein